MISGATRGAGGRALGAHLADAKQLNERTELGLSRGLVGATIREQIAELTDLSSHSRAAQPLYHLHADPPPGAAWNETTWQRYWSLTEKEFDLERAAFSEERHLKDGREHRHRVYNLVRADGTTNPMAHDFQRREKLSRIMEFETGAPLTPGAHNRAAIAALDRGGRPDVAAAMREAGLDTVERPRAAISPQQRAQAERTGVNPQALGATVLTAWRVSDDAAAFRTALAEQGLQLAQGDRAAVVVDATGDVHPLARMLGRESKAAGGVRIAAGDVTARLVGVDLPRHVPGAVGEPVSVLATVETLPAPITSPAPTEPAAFEAAAITEVHQAEPETAPAPEASDSAPAAGRPALIMSGSSGRAASLGGGGGGGGSDPFAGIAPLDLSKPNDWLRFLNQTANAQAAKLKADAAAEAARTTKGGSHADPQPKPDHNQPSLADAIADAIQRGREIRAERAARTAGPSPGASADEPRMDPGGSARDRSPDGEGPGRAAAGDRPPGAVADRVRGVPGRADLGSAPPPPGPPPAEGGRGQNRDPHRSGGNAAGRGEGDESRDSGPPERNPPSPSRAALDGGRDRAEAGRVEIALAGHAAALDRIKQKAADLRNPEAAAARQRTAEQAALNGQVAASRARVAAVLSTSPWPDPADRSRTRLQDAARDRVTASKDTTEATAAAAAAKAAELRERVGIVARVLALVGLETPSIQAAREAERIADEARRAAHAVRLDYRENLAHGERLGAAQATQREEQQGGWERRPDVAGARREAHGNDLVAAALKSGNPEIKDILKEEGGLRAAREMLLRQEAERVAEIQRQQQHHDQRTAAATVLRPGPAAPTPGFRR